MATILKASKAVAYYSGEVNINSPLAGYLTGYRVMRYTFTTPASGATSYRISITGVSMYSNNYPTLRFYLTSDASSHINANGTSSYDGELIRSAVSSGESGQHKYTSNAVSKVLIPNETYYLYIFAGNSNARSAYFPYDGLQYKTELATIIVEGSSIYTVSYDANGGTGAPSSQTKTHGTALTLSSTKPTKTTTTDATYTVTFNANGGTCSTATLSSSKKTSYTFSKWNTKSDGSGTSYASGASYTTESNLTLYAQYTSSTSTGAITLPTPTRAGYSFLGWATSPTATSGTTGSYTPAESLTLYAIWKPNGLIHISNGSTFNKYTVHIYNGSSWGQYIPYIYDGTDWVLYS